MGCYVALNHSAWELGQMSADEIEAIGRCANCLEFFQDCGCWMGRDRQFTTVVVKPDVFRWLTEGAPRG